MRTGHAISDAWLAHDLPREDAQEVIDRVWNAYADSGPWREWFETHLRPREVFTVAYFEERPRRRLEVRGDTLSFYVPAEELRRAHRDGTLEEWAREAYVAIHTKWADKLGVPDPPTGHRVDVPSAQQG